MKLVGAGWQGKRDFAYYADGTIASGSAPQLVLPEHPSRSFLNFQNTDAAATIWIGFGSARASCTLSSGKVNSVSIINAGFGFTRAPIVQFLGGGILPQQGDYPPNTSYVGAAGPVFPSPSHPAQGHCVMSGSAGALTVASITIDDPGSGYVIAPMVFISNDPLDPNGCFDPSVSSGSGFKFGPGGAIYFAGSAVTTDQLAIFSSTMSATFACQWMP